MVVALSQQIIMLVRVNRQLDEPLCAIQDSREHVMAIPEIATSQTGLDQQGSHHDEASRLSTKNLGP